MEQAARYLNFLGIDDPADAGVARFRVLPVPYDLTTTYQAGTRRGPLAILEASTHVEWYDEFLGFEPADAGILTLAPVEPESSGPGAMMERVEAAARREVGEDRLLLALGGEHSITAPLVRAHREVWPELTVLQVDAHADLRESYAGSPHSHACVMRRIVEAGVPLVQVGLRSLTGEEHRFMEEHGGVHAFFAHDLAGRSPREWALEVAGLLGREVYVTIDLDGLDPSIMPATGTPEPGGLSWWDLTVLLDVVARSSRIVGADLVELAPIPGMVAPDFLAARLAYRLMGLVARQRGWVKRGT